ncbi:MAG: hypothetical protein AB1798_15530, partial [Spirochaetota bacterium]
QYMEDMIAEAGIEAWEKAVPAKIGLVTADGTGVGTNRRDPKGPFDPEVPVLAVKTTDNKHIAVMLVYSMHPTVLHEDSKLVSADFPGMTRQYLQKNVLGENCPVLYHTGPEGNQSPRHVTKGNTFEEAERLGHILGKAVEKVLPKMTMTSSCDIRIKQILLDLPGKAFPSIPEAKKKLKSAIMKLETLRKNGAPRREVRTAECDWFGAEETVTLARAAADGRIKKEYLTCLPAEIQVVKLGLWNFVGWPGEVFIEYALAVKKDFSNTYIINLANGELQGYIVTEEAALEGGYEASNGLFAPESGRILVDETIKALHEITEQ